MYLAQAEAENGDCSAVATLLGMGGTTGEHLGKLLGRQPAETRQQND